MKYRYLVCDPYNGIQSGTNSSELAKLISAKSSDSVFDVVTGLWMYPDGSLCDDDPLENAENDYDWLVAQSI